MSKTTTLHVHHAFLYISLPSLHNNDVKWPILGLLGNGNGKAINSTIPVWTRVWSLLFISNPKSIISATLSWTSQLSVRKVPSVARVDRTARQNSRLAVFPHISCFSSKMSSNVTSRCILGLTGKTTWSANNTNTKMSWSISCFIHRLSYYIHHRDQLLKRIKENRKHKKVRSNALAGNPRQGGFTTETRPQRKRRLEFQCE